MKLLIKNGAKPDYKTALKKAKQIRFNILLNFLYNLKEPFKLNDEEIEIVESKRTFEEVIKYLREIQKEVGLEEETMATAESSFKKVIDYLTNSQIYQDTQSQLQEQTTVFNLKPSSHLLPNGSQ